MAFERGQVVNNIKLCIRNWKWWGSGGVDCIAWIIIILSVLSKCDKEADLCTDHFEKSVKMSTYLVAFVVCDYKSIQSQTQKGIKVSVLYSTWSI